MVSALSSMVSALNYVELAPSQAPSACQPNGAVTLGSDGYATTQLVSGQLYFYYTQLGGTPAAAYVYWGDVSCPSGCANYYDQQKLFGVIGVICNTTGSPYKMYAKLGTNDYWLTSNCSQVTPDPSSSIATTTTCVDLGKFSTR